MAKNGQKRVEIFGGASHMINNNIFNVFNFSTFSLAQDYKPVMLCTFVLYLYSSTITAKYIRLRSDLIPRTPKVYRGADDQSYQTWLLLHSTMQCPTVTVQIIVC